jgi:hypothetical protein
MVKLPDDQTLAVGLSSLLQSKGIRKGSLRILSRAPNPHSSSFASEVVTCQLGRGAGIRLLCKYGIRNEGTSYGHRGGVGYEADVYRHVLNPLKLSKPKFFGTYDDPVDGLTWLVVEYIADALRVSKTSGPTGMRQAARWIARFHAAQQAHLVNNPIPTLTRYQNDYYLGWIHRTEDFVGDLHGQFPWLAKLCNSFSKLVPSIATLPTTVIHGEYSVQNVIVARRTVYPVDWESAAIAFGEIDLATLTDGWPEIAPDCEREYRTARWPDGVPENFEYTVALARAYVQFRWLGERQAWTRDERVLWRFKDLHEAGRKLRLI